MRESISVRLRSRIERFARRVRETTEKNRREDGTDGTKRAVFGKEGGDVRRGRGRRDVEEARRRRRAKELR